MKSKNNKLTNWKKELSPTNLTMIIGMCDLKYSTKPLRTFIDNLLLEFVSNVEYSLMENKPEEFDTQKFRNFITNQLIQIARKYGVDIKEEK